MTGVENENEMLGILESQALEQPPTPLSEVQSSPQVHRTLEGLLQITNLVGSVMMLEDILNEIVRITSGLMSVPVCSIYLLDESKEHLVLRSNVGFEPELVGRAFFGKDQGIPGYVLEKGDTIWLADARFHPAYAPLPSTLELNCKAYICSPLRIQQEIIGVMTARRTDVYEFSELDVLFFETICKNVAIVIEKARLYHEKLQAEHLAAVAVSLTGVAHYIKNVLFTMKGAEFLVDQGLIKEDLRGARDGWEVLKRSNKKIRGLVENILNYCRQEELPNESVMLNEMINEIINAVSVTAAERQVEIIPQLDEGVGVVEINRETFYDAILNLITNAVEAIPQDRPGRVWVRTQPLPNRNQVRIDIVDDGAGIPEENREKIFNLFFSTKGKQGTGIGLAATRKIIEDHAGTIEIANDLEQGAHFVIYLPASLQANDTQG